MGLQEYRTSVEGQIYIINNATDDTLIMSAVERLIDLHECIYKHRSDKQVALLEDIRDAIEPYIYVPQNAYDDTLEDSQDVKDVVCVSSFIWTTSVILTTFYMYSFYAWLNGCA